MNEPTKTEASVEGRTVTLERTYDAAPALVWRAWTDPDVLARWYGCQPDKLWTIHQWDAAVGGRVHLSMDFDGVPFVIEGEFLAVEEPSLLRYSFGEGQTITVTIAAEGSGSRVVVSHDGLPTGEMEAIVTEGWTSSLTELAGAVS